MLDGFVLDEVKIEGNVLEQAPSNAERVKTLELKKYSTTILASVIVHLVLFIMLFFMSTKQQPKLIKQEKIIPKAIKSYLYKAPAKPVVIAKPAITKQAEVKQQQPVAKVTEKTIELKQDKSITPTPTAERLSIKTESKNHQAVPATFSSYQQLDNLRNAINKKMMSQEFSALQQFRSPSVMHGKQIPVPHSNKQLTPEQERENKVTRMSNDISITKYDNGLCTIEREQFLGSPVEGSSSAFACGENKFDKSFREHMKKVRDKIMPTKNK